VTAKASDAYYFAGVVTSQPLIDGTEEVLFPQGNYLILSGQGGLSRLAFDKLEDQAFTEILAGDFPYEYNGGPIAEILLNGNPADAVVEVWVPVIRKS
jgi:predicted transcriptional regulator YdeE